MTSIQALGHPLVYRAQARARLPAWTETDVVAVRAEVRALEGMQKEALIHYGPSRTVWRMVSDEGPYLNGTDLAPFPLAFYTTGMALSFTSEVLRHAREAVVSLAGYRLVQDSFYTMEGSALRGDMLGGALPVEMTVEIEADAPAGLVRQIVERARQSSPPQAYMSRPLANTFALCHNGLEVTPGDVAASPVGIQADPAPFFASAEPLADVGQVEDIIVKTNEAEKLFGVEGGAGSSLQATQKRTLHVRGICTLRGDGLKEVLVQLFKPIGSTFRFLSDDSRADGGQERAPSALAYVAAGIGFCFMTQIGRYAHIVKQDLKAYRIVQDTLFRVQAEAADALPVDTHVFLESGESDGAAAQTLRMSERTCFLHAAMRLSNPTRLSLVLNGEAV